MTPPAADRLGTTFAVDDVAVAERRLPTIKTLDAVRRLTARDVECCCDYTDDCVRQVDFHPLLAAVHLAFGMHLPLVLSPDQVWIAILQGVAQHVRLHAERLRPMLVAHQEKRTLRVESTEIIAGSPENPWPDVVEGFDASLRRELGSTYDLLACDFSTTGPLERTVSAIALMDTYQSYYEYVGETICGIPRISLEGSPADWRRLRDKLAALERFDLEWWLAELRKIVAQFVAAAEGRPDVEFWREIYKLHYAYGADRVNGWFVRLFPYVMDWQVRDFRTRNPLRAGAAHEGVPTNALPWGWSAVPFQWTYAGVTRDLEFVGGFFGVTQDPLSFAVRPKLGWAVRRRKAQS
jgi:hypothetical protein